MPKQTKNQLPANVDVEYRLQRVVTADGRRFWQYLVIRPEGTTKSSHCYYDPETALNIALGVKGP